MFCCILEHDFDDILCPSPVLSIVSCLGFHPENCSMKKNICWKVAAKAAAVCSPSLLVVACVLLKMQQRFRISHLSGLVNAWRVLSRAAPG